MATHGKAGGVYIGANQTSVQITETTSWSIDLDGNPIELITHGSNWARNLLGVKRWSGTVEANLKMNSNQTLVSERLVNATESMVTLHFYETSATIPRDYGQALITGRTATGPADGVETTSFTFVGEGTLYHINA